MKRIITYIDWQMNYDENEDAYYVTEISEGESRCSKCELIELTDDSSHTEDELLKGSFIGGKFDYGGELDEPIVIDKGIDGETHRYEYIYQYGYWKKIVEKENEK